MRTMAGLLILLLGGCATAVRPPPEVAHIQLTKEASPRLDVHTIQLGRDERGVYVAGSVHRRWGTDIADAVHLDVTVYGRDGAVLGSESARFETVPVRRGHAAVGVSQYRVYVSVDPQEIRRIDVRADEQPHA
ncbi:hypothetical protein [Opitutus terrae]|uniref:Lipoprotein n=1 Tax=Opitutus terrae (strain DSM 11246 / JCM 15787 / PB90-1) TaxID=452637 RepID=B1ZYA5_OPITP|nr:hypothetical protein [Opitutus terrae]ACB76251.1 hypothetical protein Oter_2970 [Opitutus terrae PB90-1]